MPAASGASERQRLGWVDVAKGLCILLVVLFHSTLGVEKDLGAETWMHAVIEWARPFRMPDFFLISGLFLAARIHQPWRQFIDSKVVHFAYFYVLWFNIHFALRLKPLVAEVGTQAALKQYLAGYVEPYGSLWFIYLLAVYFVITKLVRNQPVWLVGSLAVAAHLGAPHTGSFLVDEFFSRFLFFYTGYAFAGPIFAYARSVERLPTIIAVLLILLWAEFNTAGLVTGLAKAPVAELAFAAAGIAAVIAFSVVLTGATGWTAVLARGLAYCGRNSIVIYLAFTIGMALTRAIVLKTAAKLGLAIDGGFVAIVCGIVGVTSAIVMHVLARGTWAAFLFERPQAFRLRAPAPEAVEPEDVAPPPPSPRALERRARVIRGMKPGQTTRIEGVRMDRLAAALR